MFFIYFLVFYSIMLFSVTSIFSFSNPHILLSDNFECGFYPILISMLKYKLNYWILTIYFLIFEQELILVLLLTFSMKTLNENIILCFLLGLLVVDVLMYNQLPLKWIFVMCLLNYLWIILSYLYIIYLFFGHALLILYYSIHIFLFLFKLTFLAIPIIYHGILINE